MAEELNIELLFVPAGLTSTFQPLDVGFNAVVKHKHSSVFRNKMFDDNTAPYPPSAAVEDLVTITKQLSPKSVRAGWDKVKAKCKERIAQLAQSSVVIHPSEDDLIDVDIDE